MVEALGSVLRVIGPDEHNAAVRARDEEVAHAEDAARSSAGDLSSLGSYIRAQLDIFRRHRDTGGSGWSERLLHALRVFNGEYDPQKLSEIEKFGGSTAYARIVAMKCRGASSLLRDVYLSPDRPWGLDASDDPSVPPEILKSVNELVQMELQQMGAMGQEPDIDSIRDRTMQLVEAARQAAKRKAEGGARIAEDKLDELLKQGGFYKALAEFITDLPLFPFACIKGPVVRILPVVTWEGNSAAVRQVPRLTWTRVSPFDLWWTPGVADIEDAAVIERTRLTRADLNDLLDLPGYNTDAIREILDLYGRGGLMDEPDSTESERAIHESRENPHFNQSGLINCYEFTGNVQGRMLLEYGMDEELIPDPMRDYFVQAWVVGRYVIKVQLAPSPRKRHPYFITSFEKVPGTPVGNGLPDILDDIQEAGNATFRSLINNLSIASGPQVVVNDDRLSGDEDGEDLYPWKRWHVQSDPMGNNTLQPITFFQPNSNAQELLGVYQQFVNMADELSAIPKYLSGAGTTSGAGRTASGLAMLMGNASKILQTVAANIDRDVLEPLLSMLFDMVMLTDQSGVLTGEEKVRVLGVSVAVQKETQRARQLEFLQITANPIDAQIVGPKGRAAILRNVATTIGMPGEEIVPSSDEMDAMQKMSQAMAQQSGVPGHSGLGENAANAQGGQNSTGASGDMGPRTNISGGSQ
ncbi:MAG TPA: hemophilus-specific protein [Acidimicrobiia bacterium]